MTAHPTKNGFTIDMAIQSAVDAPLVDAVQVGCIAGDEETYSAFALLFDEVIYEVCSECNSCRLQYKLFMIVTIVAKPIPSCVACPFPSKYCAPCGRFELTPVGLTDTVLYCI
jgi:hypothetical protein